MHLKKVVLVVMCLALNVSCEKNSNDTEPLVIGDYQSGILVSNEGPFNNGTGTVSFISEDLSTVENTIYNKVNTEDLGNVVQSIGFAEEKAYVIANVSNTISVVNRNTFEKIATITTGLSNPRYFAAINGKGYVTNWGDPADETDDYVAVINIATNAIEGTIPVAFGPEELVAQDTGKVYVAHQGGFGQNNKVSVIDSSTNEVNTTITVGDVPNSLQFDGDGNLWVLCGGKPSFTEDETAGTLFKVDTTTDTAEKSIDFDVSEHPNHLNRNGNDFYYALNGEVFKINTTETMAPETSVFSGLSIYAMTTSDNKLYITDAKDFASNGTLSIFDLNTKEELKTLEVGLIPGGIYFN